MIHAKMVFVAGLVMAPNGGMSLPLSADDALGEFKRPTTPAQLKRTGTVYKI
jgi:hypothetical protein